MCVYCTSLEKPNISVVSGKAFPIAVAVCNAIHALDFPSAKPLRSQHVLHQHPIDSDRSTMTTTRFNVKGGLVKTLTSPKFIFQAFGVTNPDLVTRAVLSLAANSPVIRFRVVLSSIFPTILSLSTRYS